MKKIVIVGCIITVCLVIGATILASILFNRTENGHALTAGGGDLILECELPTERPTVAAITVNCPTITNPSQAKSYAIQLYPSYESVNFGEFDGVDYRAELDDESLYVYPSGIMVNRHFNDNVTYVDIDDFPIAAARSIATSYINSHGGLGAFSEVFGQPQRIADDEGNPTDIIMGYEFIYQRAYGGFHIYGNDQIIIFIDPKGPSFDECCRGVFVLGGTFSSQQVISASTAWTNLLEEINSADVDLPNINIVSVGLCYYIPTKDVISVMYPAWKFTSDENLGFYVNAFTGEYMY